MIFELHLVLSFVCSDMYLQGVAQTQILRASSEDGFVHGLCYQSSGPYNFCKNTTIKAVEG
jgi:hypothetical protein